MADHHTTQTTGDIASLFNPHHVESCNDVIDVTIGTHPTY